MFIAFENWWDDQHKRETKDQVSATPTLSSGTQTQQQPFKQITPANEQQPLTSAKKPGFGFEGLNLGFGLGLGLRAAMPKLPSFRVSAALFY